MNLHLITHYYLPDKQPFLSLSDLNGDIDHPAFQEMLNRHKVDPHYNRRFGINYLKTRMAVEEKLRDCFIKRGGNPVRQHPVYFILGESRWFQSLNGNHVKLQIPIPVLPNDKVSVTFPDSYLAMTASTKPYFEKIYFLNELEELVTKYGVPKDIVPDSYERYWEGDFEHYFEVQVWDDEVLHPYLIQPT